MALHSQVREMLEAGANEPLPYLRPVSEARQWLEEILIVPTAERLPLHRVEERLVPAPDAKIPVRVYWPSAKPGLPILYYVHGGGWVVGSMDTHDDVCRQIAKHADCITVSVEYRRAPEHKFPGPLQDVYFVAQWVIHNAANLGGDPRRIAIGGDSAGGNLSAATVLLARDRGDTTFMHQVLLYPVTDYFLPGTESYRQFALGYGLDRDFMIWFWNHYVNHTVDLDNPYLNPLRASDLGGLPPAYVMTAEYDPLRDEGRGYAESLQSAGVSVTYRHYDDMVHGFLDKRQLTTGREALREIGEHLREVFMQ